MKLKLDPKKREELTRYMNTAKMAKYRGDTMPDQREWKELQERVYLLERRLEAIEEQESTEPWHTDYLGPESLVEFNHKPGELGGIVVDEGLARATPCKCFSTPSGKQICFSKGVVGAMSDEGQIALYCPTKDIMPLTQEQTDRMEAWKAAVSTCQARIQSLPHEERLPEYLKCMSEEGKRKGFKI